MAEDEKLLEYLKRVTVDLHDTRERLKRAEESAREPIAIVGMGCRFPGGADSPEALWNLVDRGGDAIGEFPTDRGWDLDRLFGESSGVPEQTYVRTGGFLPDAVDFDAEFFGINRTEAIAMDPQQRLFLQAGVHALEDAGINPFSLRGTSTGVFAGLMYHEYGSSSEPLEREVAAYLGTGVSGAVLSGRMSYLFGLEGPAITLDTACSSSLTAIHLACGSLRSGECSLALAGGVSVMASPGVFVGLSLVHGLARDGRCKSFSDHADGTSISEGAGIVALERLSDTLESGRRVLAVIRASAVNQDGASNGLSAPNGPSQERVIRQALANAGLAARDIGVLEAHGTGTPLGDPIEAQALLATYGRNRPVDRPLRLGSIKSNIGHAQAAAGIAGVIKIVKCLEHESLPATLHAHTPSSQVDWSSGAVSLLRESRDWPRTAEPRRAAVSSFGISGTNAHVIIEEPPTEAGSRHSPVRLAPGGTLATEQAGAVVEDAVADSGLSTGGEMLAWPLSGRDAPSLRRYARATAQMIETRRDLDPGDLAASLTARPAFAHRAVVIGADGRELLAGLWALVRGDSAPNVLEGALGSGERAVFVFPGQGGQWLGMAAPLLDGSPVFAAEMRRCEQEFSRHVDWSLLDVVRGESGCPDITGLDVLQPVLFAVMVSLAALWRAFDVEPAAVVGHSQGEVAAAYVAGGLSLPDAARVVALRSRLFARIGELGGIVSVALGVEEVERMIAPWEGRLAVASINAPTNVGVVGDGDAIAELMQALKEHDVRAREIPATPPSHCPMVDELREEALAGLASISPVAADVSFYSTVTGGLLDTSRLDGEYWYENMRRPVLFEAAVRSALEREVGALLEVSPHPVLNAALRETLDGMDAQRAGAVVLGSLRREEGGFERFYRSLAELWAHCGVVDWRMSPRVARGSDVVLPVYPFKRERHWLSTPRSGSGDARGVGQESTAHPLLRAAQSLAELDRRCVLTGRLALESHRWLGDHTLAGEVWFPECGMLELALSAGAQVGCDVVHELECERPLLLPRDGAVHLQILVGAPGPDGRRSVGIHSRIELAAERALLDEWTTHARGTLGAQALRAAAEDAIVTAGGDRQQDREQIDLEALHDELAAADLDLGSAFLGIGSAWRAGDEMVAQIEAPEGLDLKGFAVHPALLDAAVRLASFGDPGERAKHEGHFWTPHIWRDVHCSPTDSSKLTARIVAAGDGVCSLELTDDLERAVLRGSVVMSELSPERRAQMGAPSRSRSLFALDWREFELPRVASTGRLFVLAQAHSDSGAPDAASGDLSTQLRADGDLPFSVGDQRVEARATVSELPGDLCEHDTVLLDLRAAGEEVVASAHRIADNALVALQSLLSEESGVAPHVGVLTHRALAARAGEGVEDVAASVVLGLARTAQMENPGRLTLVDVDDEHVSLRMIPVAVASEEPQIAIRDGQALRARLARANAAIVPPRLLDPSRTVLITGGLTGLGALIARHLAGVHKVRSLMIAARSGPKAQHAERLRHELTGLGAEVRIVACDVSSREQVADLLARVPGEMPLGAVVHSAAVLDDGVLQSLTPDRLGSVLRPKVDGAWHLHELTSQLDLSAFVLFSSVAGVLGNPGQANYAAANAFLDALATHRRSRGLPGVSIAWGRWEQADLDSVALRAADLDRLARLGVSPLAADEGLRLFDLAVAGESSSAIALRLDLPKVRALARDGIVIPLLSDVVGVAASAPEESGRRLAMRLEGVAPDEREEAVLQFVRAEIAVVTGRGVEEIEADVTFKDLGFDSLGAVDLRNRLATASGLRLPATLIFSYPTPAALAGYLASEARVSGPDANEDSAEAGLRRLEALLERTEPPAEELERLGSRLRALAGELQTRDRGAEEGLADRIQAASTEELFEMVEREWAEEAPPAVNGMQGEHF